MFETYVRKTRRQRYILTLLIIINLLVGPRFIQTAAICLSSNIFRQLMSKINIQGWFHGNKQLTITQATLKKGLIKKIRDPYVILDMNTW